MTLKKEDDLFKKQKKKEDENYQNTFLIRIRISQS